ncbi:MAG: hypothetical protein KBS57_06445, partial [Alistipes sp.]|nr:hypothetical protein [Candidatus Minthomonas equi]
LSKGKQEAEQMKATAQEEAARIVAQARAEAEKIIAEARKQAEEIRTNTTNDLRMASVQTIASIRKQVENLIVAKTTVAPLESAMSDDEFIKELLMTIARAFNPSAAEAVPLEVIFPASRQKEMAAFVEKKAVDVMGKGLEVSFSKHFKNGFKIAPKGEGYAISFTEEDFSGMLSDFLRPGTKKLIFG